MKLLLALSMSTLSGAAAYSKENGGYKQGVFGLCSRVHNLTLDLSKTLPQGAPSSIT